MRKMDKAQTIILVINVSVIVFSSLMLYNIIDSGNTAYVWGEVHSSNEIEPVDVIIYIEGEEVRWYEGLEPGEVFTFMWMCEFSFFERTKSIEVIAVSVGESGSHTDSELISMKNSNLYSIELYV